MPKSTTPTAREREVYRYYQPLEKSGASANEAPRSSSDPAMTAFAQLGAHRLHGKRGLITLSTRDTEYIIAESGVGLSLQKDDDKNDPLWHGATALKDNCGLGRDLCKIFCNDEDTNYAVFNDISLVEPFSEKRVVTEAPFIKFLACVPLRSPLYNMVIGTYIVVDDKPRDGLTESEIEFLVDMGVTVMDHLEAQRLNQKQHRSERMVKAIGLFIEGKSSLRDWWLEGGFKSQHSRVKKRQRNGASLDGQADLEFGVQDPPEGPSSKAVGSLSEENTKIARPTLSRSPSSSTLSHVDRGGDGRPMIPARDSAFSYSDTTIPSSAVFSKSGLPRNSSVTTFDTTEGSTVDPAVRHSSVAFDLPQDAMGSDLSKELQEALLTKDLKAVFSRASNLIREAGGVDGSIFFDASIGSFGAASESDAMGEKAPGTFHIDDGLITSEDDLGRRASDTDTSIKESTAPTETCCNILGFSTRKRSSLRGHTPPLEHHTFPERVLRTLLKRYPHGKVFNFDEDGSFSSSDSDNAYLGKEVHPSEPRRHVNEGLARKKRVSREAEAAALLRALPGARSIFWFPLWDQGRERWYAGSLVWSTCPTRILCPIEDLTYLAAFGNSIMAEVSRLSALVLTQMKTDFISSISHELRSPLHGVLASVEFLQETPMSEVQADMVANISASGRVLLDTINHVLDFSKVNKKVKEKGKIRRKLGKRTKSSVSNQEGSDTASDDTADVCVLSEEVIESVYAGRKMTKSTYDGGFARKTSSRPQSIIGVPEPPVTIIMDISCRTNWNFEMDAGAWSRILLNLFGNSMKYTKSGFVKVSLNIEEDSSSRSRKLRSQLVLRVKDSGKGISKEFLKHHLYKPFTQEDSLAVGAGLGLSIVRHIVQDLGGEINFISEQGVGTEAIVKLPMSSTRQPNAEDTEVVTEVKAAAKGKTFHLEGFDRYPDISETPTGILSADFEGAMFLKSSTHNMLTDWFGMQPAVTQISNKSGSDIVVLMESGIGAIDESLKYYKELRETGSGPSTAIVLCNSYPPDPQLHAYEPLKVFFVPQPYGPHKLARILHHAFCESQPEALPLKTNGTSSELPQTTTIIPPTSLPTSSTALPTNPPPPTQTPSTASPSTQEIQSPISPPVLIPDHTLFDRRVSIDTTVIKTDGMRILLVEDNEINLKLLVAYMRKLKLNHATAINGLEALNAYKDAHGRFDAIFMDISMPIMSGIESTRHIRRFEREHGLHPVALIALTGAANPNTRQEAFSSGVDLFLTKPVPMKNLKVMLDDLREGGRKALMPSVG